MKDFRTAYLDHEELSAQLHAWAVAHPDVVRVQSIGKTLEGRDLWLVVIGKEPDRLRPAMWIDGNMHAMELAGSSVALAFADDLIKLHTTLQTGADDVLGLPKPARGALTESLVYILPRMSPDGAEAVLKTGRYVRSTPVDDRPDKLTARWRIEDIDGDGLALTMRAQDAAGDFVESKAIPGLMVARGIDDEGPFFKLFPEGTIEAFDGHQVPAWQYFDDNRRDLNRNFPWSWAPEGNQAGAGAFSTSTPEARAVVELTSRSPHLMAWINLHTFGGVYIRPPGHQADAKIDREDLEVFRQIGAWVEEHTGYATVSGFEEFLYQPDKPLRGDVSDYAYNQLGCIAFAVELWDLMKQAGLPRKKPFIDTYQQQGRAEVEKIAAWDRDTNQGRTLRPWKKCRHPQLGDVEIGGIDPRFGVWNPPPEMLNDTCVKNSRVFARVLAMLPRLQVRAHRESVGPGKSRIEVNVTNVGYLASHGLSSAKKLAHAEPVHVELLFPGGAPDAPHAAQATHAAHPSARAVDEHKKSLGHLDGWGRGLWGGSSTWPYQTSTAPQTSKRATFLVDGDGPVTVRVGSCRVGFVEKTL